MRTAERSSYPFHPLRNTPATVFGNWALEHIFHVPAVMPALVYGPIVCLALLAAPGRPLYVGTVLVLGVLSWSLFEYLAHRFVFHVRPWGPRTHQVIYVTHGVHHVYPDDKKDVATPFVTIFIGAGLWWAMPHIVGPMAARPFFAGFTLGYLLYESVHHLLHHTHPTNPVGRALVRYHMRHHFQDPDSRFGVSTPLWDVVFGTMGSVPAERRSAQSPAAP